MTAGGTLPISGITLENFRSFERYDVPCLSRVSLITGKHGSGKTSVLEAVELLASPVGPDSLIRLARRRGHEPIPIRDEGADADDGWSARGYDVGQFFHGGDLTPGRSFCIADEGDGGVVSAFITDSASQPEVRIPRVAERRPWGGHAGAMTLVFGPEGSGDPVGVPMTANGLLIVEDDHAASRTPTGVGPRRVTYLGPESVSAAELSRWWDAVQQPDRETEVVSTLGLLDPAPDSVSVVPVEDASGRPATGQIRLDFAEGRRVWLADCGEGPRRLLALSLALEQAAGGILLADEIAAGLHPSVLYRMWLPIIRTALALDIQVVATTQNYDCLRGLDWALRSYPDLADAASVHGLRRHLDSAIRSDADRLALAIEYRIELR